MAEGFARGRGAAWVTEADKARSARLLVHILKEKEMTTEIKVLSTSFLQDYDISRKGMTESKQENTRELIKLLALTFVNIIILISNFDFDL